MTGGQRAAARAREARRSRMIAYGQWQPFTDAQPVRAHVQSLMDAGTGWRRVAEMAGVSRNTVHKLMFGTGACRTPSHRIRPHLAAALLAVHPLQPEPDGNVLTDATGSRRRIRALVACGWSQAKIAARLGMAPPSLCELLNRQPKLRASRARAIAALYDELWDVPPPRASARDRMAASRARNYARSRNWPPPLAWDDDLIDNPAASPAKGWRRREGEEAA